MELSRISVKQLNVYTKSVEQGDAEAQFVLGVSYIMKKILMILKRDINKVVKWWEGSLLNKAMKCR